MGISSNMQVTGSNVFDPMTPSNLQDPFVFFAKLRKEKPVYWNEQYSFCMLTRYQDVKAVLRAPRQFSSATGIEIDKRAEQIPQFARASFDIWKRFAYTHMQASDPPKHTDQRGAVVNAFTAQVVAEMRTSIQQRVDRLLDEKERAETCDFVSEFAYPLPSMVIFDLLASPPSIMILFVKQLEWDQLLRAPYTSTISKRWNTSPNDSLRSKEYTDD